MENNKTSPETLEEGCVESKLSQSENPCNKILGEVDSVLLCNLSENCKTDVYSGDCELSHVELSRKLGNVSLEESVCDGFVGNNQINEGSFYSYVEDKLSFLNAGAIKSNDVLVLEGKLKLSENEGIQIGKVEEKSDDLLHAHELVQVDEPMEKGDNVLHSHEPCSPTKIEVSGKGINLFVDVFGPLDVTSRRHMSGENGSMPPGFKNTSAKNEGEEIVGEKNEEQECTFDVGDFVWVKTRNQLWWPGMISDPCNAANDAAKSEKRGSVLVKYFGSANFIWCGSSDLKPFLEYFEQMSGQKNSPNFSGSVERALYEIGQRVKSNMTCPCFAKDGQKRQLSRGNMEENSMSMDRKNNFDVLSFSWFEPATFLARVRYLACSVYEPSKIELTVMKNRLSSFYCSIGHCGLPLHLLRSGSDAAQNAQDGSTSVVIDEANYNVSGGSRNSAKARDGDLTVSRRRKRNNRDNPDFILGDKIAPSGKGSESRERKKSKYLSYPYIDVNQGLNVSTSPKETEDLKNPSSLSAKPNALASCSGKNSSKRGSRKPHKHHIVSKADDIDACSAELRGELCSTARDCFYLSRSKYSDTLKIFYSSFRIYTFLDADIASMVSESPEAEMQIEGVSTVKASGNKRVNRKSVKESVENASCKTFLETDKQGKGNVTHKRAKKKKEQAISAGLESKDGGSQQAPNIEKCLLQSSTEAGVQLEGISAEKALGKTFSKTNNPQGKGNVAQKRAKKKKEQAISAGLESTKNSLNIGTNINANGSCMINFQQTSSDAPQSSTTSKKIEGTSQLLPGIGSISRLPDLNGTQPNLSAEHFPVGGASTNLPEQRIGGLASPNMNGFDQMVFTSISLAKEAPATIQNIPHSGDGLNDTSKCWNEQFRPNHLECNVTNVGPSSFVHQPLQMGIFAFAGKPEGKKRKRKEKSSQAASVIPDLNGNVLDMNSSSKTLPEGNHISPEGESQEKTNISPSGESGSNVKPKRVLNKIEDLGGSLVLNFAPGCTVPSKETLVAKFSRYGLLKESEIQVPNDSSVQIVYERSSDAKFAFRSLEKNKTFGESLVSFNLHCMPDPASSKKTTEKKIKPLIPVARKNPAKHVEPPQMSLMRQNVEKMKLALEKAGDSLSPEMRAKLENEIKFFLDKYGSVAGSSSS